MEKGRLEGGAIEERKMKSGVMRGKPERLSKRSEGESKAEEGHFSGIQGSLGAR